MAAPGIDPPRAVFIVCGAALVWGAAEATWFFLVPDILLTFVALRLGAKVGLIAALAAATGAALGGTAMALLAAADPATALALLRSVPFLSDDAIRRGLLGMADTGWPLAMLRGSFAGIPYKVFAVGAGENAVPLSALLLATIPVRLVRFAAATGIVAWLGALSAGTASLGARMALLAAFWLLFYGEFWFRWSGWAQALLR